MKDGYKRIKCKECGRWYRLSLARQVSEREGLKMCATCENRKKLEKTFKKIINNNNN